MNRFREARETLVGLPYSEAPKRGPASRGLPHRAAAALFDVALRSYQLYEERDETVSLPVLRRGSIVYGVSQGWLAGENADRLHPEYPVVIEELLAQVRSRVVEQPVAVTLRFLLERRPDLFDAGLFGRRLRLDEGGIASLLRGSQAGAIAAERLQELLRLPATWFMTGSPDDLGAGVMDDGKLLLHELDEWGISPFQLRAARRVVVSHVESKEAGQ